MKESESYQKMFETVQSIVQEISDPQLDLDKLVSKVENGYHLIHEMRQRLDQTKMKIEQLHSEYQESTQDKESVSGGERSGMPL